MLLPWGSQCWSAESSNKVYIEYKMHFKTILEEIIVLSSDDDDEGPVKKSSSSIGMCQFNLFMSQASLRSPNISEV